VPQKREIRRAAEGAAPKVKAGKAKDKANDKPKNKARAKG
jgi:hypothetical protein